MQRLLYEGLLLSDQFLPRKTKIQLEEVLLAGREEPRVFEVLPAIILHKPGFLNGLKKDLKRHPEIRQFVQALEAGQTPRRQFFGLETADCLKAADHFQRRLRAKKIKQKSLVLNLRISLEDRKNLKALTDALNKRSFSETIRSLVSAKTIELGLHTPKTSNFYQEF